MKERKVIGNLMIRSIALKSGYFKFHFLEDTLMWKCFLFLVSAVTMFAVATNPAQADWPMTAANPQRTSWVSEQVTGTLQIEWTLPVEAYISESFHLTAANGKIYVPSSRGLYALNAVNGDLVWRKDTQLPLGEAPTIVGSTVYVPCLDRRLLALNDSNGSVIWTFDDAGAGFSSNPLVVDGVVYIGCRDGYFYAVNASNGNLVWRYPDFGYDPIGPIQFSAAYDNGKIHFAANDCYAYALNASNGTLAWKSAKLPGQQYQAFWPVIHQGKVLYTAFPGYRRSLDPGVRSVKDANGVIIGDDYHEMERKVLWPGLETAQLPTVSNPPGTWHYGNQVLDGSVICEHYEDHNDGDWRLHKPWRRILVVLDAANGSEYSWDVDNDSHPDYAPIGYQGKTGSTYPPIVGINDNLIYSAGKIGVSGGMGRANVLGWNYGTQYLSVIGTECAGDEPLAISGGGGMIYQVLCCCREGRYNGLSSGTGELWGYHNPIYDLVDRTDDAPQQVPELDVMWWGRSHIDGLQGNFGNGNGVYHDHGYQNPIIPYDGRAYVHRSNAVICYGPGPETSAPLTMLEMNDTLVDTLPTPTTQTLITRLEDEIEKMVTAGNLNPGYYDQAQFMYTFLNTHFQNPGDTLLALCRAYPHVSPALQSQLQTYLQDQFAEYFSPTTYGFKGWSEGVSRDFMEYPP
jgi:hypothetical protein